MEFAVIHLDQREPLRATDAELRTAARAGREAYAAGTSQAPSLDPTIRSLIDVGTAVGEPRTVDLFRAFTNAYQAECDRAAAEVLR